MSHSLCQSTGLLFHITPTMNAKEKEWKSKIIRDTLSILNILKDVNRTNMVQSQRAIKRWKMDLQSAGIKRQMCLAELDDWRKKAYQSRLWSYNPPVQWQEYLQGLWPNIEYIPRARITGTRRNRCLRVVRARAFVYGHRQTLNVPYPSSGRWFIFQIIFSKFCFQQR